MNISLIVLSATLIATTIATLLHTLRIWHASQECNTISKECAGCCESLGFVGCSVICSGVSNLYQIEQLLTVEYSHYEVIIVLDAQNHPTQFVAIKNQYRMIKVNCEPSQELPLSGIRNLYRSRSRNFRRLILIDRQHISPYEDFDAAASVASYGYLLPIKAHSYLYPFAIESIALALSKFENRNIDLVISHAERGCYIFRRQAIIERGGFSPYLIREIEPSATLDIYLPISHTPQHLQRLSIATKSTILLILFALCLATGLVWGIVALTATVATLLLIAVAAIFTSRLCGKPNWSLYNMFWFFRQMSLFFRPKKFIV